MYSKISKIVKYQNHHLLCSTWHWLCCKIQRDEGRCIVKILCMKGVSRDSARFGEPQQGLVNTHVAVEMSKVHCYFDARPWVIERWC